ncbi:MAG: transaldolase family protein, partial [Actinomycetes bacterium]
MNRLHTLHDAGQSIWLDFLRRGLILDGGLARLIGEDGVTGVTSNPTIFARAIGESSDYDEAIGRIAGRAGLSPLDVFY